MPPVTAWHAWANPALASGRRSRTSVSVATGPSVRGRTGGSGALASSSASSSGAAAGSPERTAQSTPIRSSPSESRQQRQPAQRRRIGPVDVVDDEHGRAALAEVAGQPDEPARGGVHRLARRRRLARLGCERALGQARRADRQLVPLRASSQRLEQLARHTPGGVLLERAAARAQHGRAVRPRDPRRQPRAGSTCRSPPGPRRRSRARSRLEPAPAAGPARPVRRRGPAGRPSPRPYARRRAQRQARGKRSWGPHDARAVVGSDDRGHDDRPHRHRDDHRRGRAAARRLRARAHARGVRAAARAGAGVGVRDRAAARPGRARAGSRLPRRRLRPGRDDAADGPACRPVGPRHRRRRRRERWARRRWRCCTTPAIASASSRAST